MSTKVTIARITAAYVALDALNDIDHRKVRDTLYAKCLAEERGHRRHNTGPYACSIDVAVKMFVVRGLAEFLSGAKPMPSIGDTLWLKDSYVYAAAVVDNYGCALRGCLEPHDLPWLSALDYVKLVNGVAQ